VYDQPYAAGTNVNIRGQVPRPGARPKRRNPFVRFVEIICWIVAALALGWVSYVQAESYFYQGEQSRKLDALLRRGNSSAAVAPAANASVTSSSSSSSAEDESLPMVTATPSPRVYAATPGELLGRIEIPRLNVSATIVEGDDTDNLRHAVGHIPGTALPWESGNIGLAGHRDSFFRKIGELRDGDQIVLTTIHGTFEFRASQFAIVKPDGVDVLSSVQQPALTLVTCYPFHYVGAAPQRFVIRAWRGTSD
jgi:sortase A